MREEAGGFGGQGLNPGCVLLGRREEEKWESTYVFGLH